MICSHHTSFIGILPLSWCMTRIFWGFFQLLWLFLPSSLWKITFLPLPTIQKMVWTLIWAKLCFRHNCSISVLIHDFNSNLFIYLIIKNTEISSNYILNWRYWYYYFNTVLEAGKGEKSFYSISGSLIFTPYNLSLVTLSTKAKF